MSFSQEKRFPEGALLVAAALLGAAMVLAALTLGRQRLGDGDDLRQGESAVSPDEDSSLPPLTRAPLGTLPQPTPPPPAEEEVDIVPLGCPEGTQPEICEAARFVQLERNRPFKTFPVVEVMVNDDFDQALLSDFDDYRADIEAGEVALKALGLLDPDVSLAEVYQDSLTAGAVGFYDADTEQLVVRGDQLDLFGEAILVHEFTHALDDQWFDLGRVMGDDEAEYGFSAVIEGNATRVEEAWRAELDPGQQRQLERDELAALSSEDLATYDELPSIVQELDLSPYTDGFIFMRSVAAAGGEEAVDAALVDPPGTSEEILDLGTDRSVDAEVILDPPPAGGQVVDEGRLGELLTRLWLGRLAASGWGGDYYVAWIDGDGRRCIIVDMVSDTEADRDDLRAAAEAWVAEGADRATDTVPVESGSALRVTGCG